MNLARRNGVFMGLWKLLPVVGWTLCVSTGAACQQVPPAQSAADQQPAGPASVSAGEDGAAPAPSSDDASAQASSKPPPAEKAEEAEANAAAPQPLPFPQATSAFGIELFRTAGATRQGNLAISPVSISTVMAMIWVGARGETRAEMTRTLRLLGTESDVGASVKTLMSAFNGLNDQHTKLRTGNGVFVERTCKLEPGFLEVTREQFRAPAESVDFIGAPEAARWLINERVAEQTERKITAILPDESVDSNSKVVVTNAVYFKGKWQSPFKPHHTYLQDFYVNGGTPQQVRMMHQSAKFKHTAADGVQLLELPYKGKGKDLSMLIVLPDEKNGLGKLERELTAERLEGWVESLQEKRVAVELPRFEMKATTPLVGPLEKLGMKRAFDPGQAEFGGMSTCALLYLENVYHQAFVKVDEQGTVAAAATAGHARPASAVISTPFVADHPFLFAIRHPASGTLLFLGRVVAP